MWVRKGLPCYRVAVATAGRSHAKRSKAICVARVSTSCTAVSRPGFTEELHAHDFDARIMVLGGEITLTRDDKAETFRAGDHCELLGGVSAHCEGGT